MTRDVLFTFLRKEVRDLRGNAQVWPGYLILPLLAVALPVVMLAFVPFNAPASLDPDLEMLLRLAGRDPLLAAYPQGERLARLMVRETGALFLIMPVILSGMSAALAIVAEKQQRTLEPILATPVSDRMLLLAKLLAAVGPAVVVTWIAAILNVIGVAVVSSMRLGTVILPGGAWLLAVLVLAPLCGVAAALVGMRASMRSKDVQAAVQVAGLWVVPAGLVLVGLVGRPALRSLVAGVVASVLVAALDWWLFRRNERRFEREEILTQWV
ncbi:MAG: ABC transporter permease [Cytophagaceae bacterium]|nr:ABC transporter permease [Gemmatimonadaceae bacterium]